MKRPSLFACKFFTIGYLCCSGMFAHSHPLQAITKLPIAPQSTPAKKVGILYSVWHGFGAAAYRGLRDEIKNRNLEFPLLSLDNVISRKTDPWAPNIWDTFGGSLLDSTGKPYRETSPFRSEDYYTFHTFPEVGVYSFYTTPWIGDWEHRREGYRLEGNDLIVNLFNENNETMRLPDIGGYVTRTNLTTNYLKITEVATQHATQLIGAGIDFIVIDSTNFFVNSDPRYISEQIGGAYISAMRPIEVLFDEWAKLREAGIDTPQIAIWQATPRQSLMYKFFLYRIYKNPRFQDLLFKAVDRTAPVDQQIPKPVMFYVNVQAPEEDLEANGSSRPWWRKRYPDAAILAEIYANGVIPVPMWTYYSPATGDYDDSLAQYSWSFVSPCVNTGFNPDNPVSRNLFTTSVNQPNTSCNQPHTRESRIGSMLPISVSYIYSSPASQPFGSSGRNRGLTLKKQFAKAFQFEFDYLMISGWNAHGAGREIGKTGSESLGLSGDPLAQWNWVDHHGLEFSQDIEPSVEERTYVTENGGQMMIDIVSDCIRRFRNDSDAGSCNQLNYDYVNTWPLYHMKNKNHILSVNWEGEVKPFIANRAEWRQICAPLKGPTDFCANDREQRGASGPFIMLRSQLSPNDRGLYRCYNPVAGRHFFTANPAECVAPYSLSPDTPLGFMRAKPSSEMPRPLRRCYRMFADDPYKNQHVHGLVRCPPPEVGNETVRDEGILGYVR